MIVAAVSEKHQRRFVARRIITKNIRIKDSLVRCRKRNGMLRQGVAEFPWIFQHFTTCNYESSIDAKIVPEIKKEPWWDKRNGANVI